MEESVKTNARNQETMGIFLVSNTASLGDDVLHVLNLPLATGEGTEL